MSSQHDYCVLCAKEGELTEVIKVFNDHFEARRGDYSADRVYAVPTRTGTGAAGEPGMQTIFATTCVGMGHTAAAVRTAQVIKIHQPGVIIFLGTAAALRPHEIQLGDVVIPKKAILRVYDKVSEKCPKEVAQLAAEGFREMFFGNNALHSDIDTASCSPEALAAMATIPVSEINLEQGTQASIVLGGETIQLRAPKIVKDVDIFSCGMVVDSISYRTFLTTMADSSMRKVGIIDMESYGFFHALAGSMNGAGVFSTGLMIRGISDYAGRKKDTEKLPTDWRSASVRNAARVAQKLISVLAST
jgi:nucleoside phosphorylase